MLKTIATLFKEYRPEIFFDIIAVVFLLIGLVIGLPAYIGYFKTGLVEKFPSLIVSCFSILMALLLFVTGLILQVIVKKQKQNYELYLNLLEVTKDKNN